MDMRSRAKELKGSCQTAISQAENEGRTMTDEEQKKYDSDFSELEGVLSQIKRADRLAEIAGDLSEPATTPVGPEASVAPDQTRDHAEVRMGKDRMNERGFDSIGEQLQAIAHASHPESRYESVDKRLHFLQERGGNPENEKRASGASEAVASDGGFLVQKDFNDRILEKVYSSNDIASRVTRQAIGPTANGLTYNMLDETSRATTRFGGLRAYWTAEAAALTASQPTFAQQTLTLNKLACLFYATEELLMDQVSLAGLVERAVPQEIAFKVEDAIMRGTGSGQPLGILNAPATVSVAKESGQTATTINATNVEKMWSRMYASSRGTMVWLINQDCEPQLTAMTSGDHPIYMPPLGLSDTPFSRLYNRPVIATEYNSTLGTVGDIMAVDLSQYMLIDKGAVMGDSSMHVRFLYDERAFRWMYRCDGQSMWNSALTPAQGTSTQSPFITLATRS
jgi:HK97 family phage major capsid protein